MHPQVPGGATETALLIVADAARARIFRRRGKRQALEPVTELQHPQSRLKNGELATGGQGASHPRKGTAMDATGPQQDAHAHEAEVFAAELAQYARDARTQQGEEAFELIAPPRFLGLLRDKLDEPTARCVTRSIDKDLVQHEQADIEAALGLEVRH